MELKACYHVILGCLLNESISGDFFVCLCVRDYLAVFQYLKRNRCRISFILGRSLCFNNSVLAIGYFAEGYDTVFAGCEYLHCISIGVVKCKFCTGQGDSGILVNLDYLNASFDGMLNKGSVNAVLDGDGFSVCLDRYRITSFVHDVIIRSLCFLHGVFTVTEISECQFAVNICFERLNSITFCIVKSKFCTLDRFIGLAVSLDKSDSSLDGSLNECAVFLILDSDNLTAVFDSDRICSLVNEVLFRCLCFLNGVAAIRNVREHKHTALVGCLCAECLAFGIIQGKLCSGNRLISLAVLLNQLDAAFDGLLNKCSVLTVLHSDDFAVGLDADGVCACVDQVIIGSFGFLHGVFTVTDVLESQFTFLVSRQYLYHFSIGIVERELCALDRFIGLAVLLDKLYTAFNRGFNKCAVCFVLNGNGLAVILNDYGISTFINQIIVGGFGFLDGVFAVTNIFEGQFAVNVCFERLNSIAFCIVKGKLCTLDRFIGFAVSLDKPDISFNWSFNKCAVFLILDSDNLTAVFDGDRICTLVNEVLFRCLCFLNGVAAIRNVREHKHTALVGCLCAECLAFGIIQGKLCSGNRLISLAVLLNQLDAAFDGLLNKCSVLTVLHSDDFAVGLDADGICAGVDQVIVGSFSLLYSVFTVTDVLEGQFTFLVSCQRLNNFSICIVECKLCAFDGFIGLAVFLNKLYAAFDRSFKELMAVTVCNGNKLSVLADSEVIRASIRYIAFRCFGFYYCIRAIRNILQFIDTFGGLCQLAIFCIALIYGKDCTGNGFVRIGGIILVNDNAALLQLILKADIGCFAGLDLNFLFLGLYISVGCFDFFDRICAF